MKTSLSKVCSLAAILILLSGCGQTNPVADLLIAADKGDASRVQKLLKKGVDPNATVGENQDTALILAANGGHVEIVRILLDAGADPNKASATDNSGGTTIIRGPIPLVQAKLAMVDMARNNPFLQAQSPQIKKLIDDPKTVERFEQILKMLEERAGQK